jgi:dTDP-4-amino-4,6-dideoxygalactose transaminase
MLKTGFSPWPSFTAAEAEAVQQVLLSNRVNYWTGTECREFETEFAAWVGTHRAVALANGTVALDVALKALGVGPGDEVVVTPRSFMASVSCVVNAGAAPVFADVDRGSGNLTAETIAAVLTPRTRTVIVVHLAGWPADMEPIMTLAGRHGFKVIEDCAQAHGARYMGRSVGSIGHVGAWSFCQDKIMTTGGEGGMVTTNDEQLWRAMWAYKDHGKSYAAVYEREHPPGFRWLHESFGTNWRMTEMQAAIGRIQLGRMAEWTRLRHRNARVLADALAPLAGPDGPIRLPRMRHTVCQEQDAPDSENCPRGCVHAQYKFYAYVRPERLAARWTRDRILKEITGLGVPCQQGSCSEIYRERAFDGTPWRPTEPLAVASELGETSLMWLVHPTLTEDEMQHVARVSVDVLRRATK